MNGNKKKKMEKFPGVCLSPNILLFPRSFGPMGVVLSHSHQDQVPSMMVTRGKGAGGKKVEGVKGIKYTMTGRRLDSER